MKYPSLGCFKVVSLDNDRSLQAKCASICHSKAGSMDIYIELVPIQQPQVSNANVVSNVSFTRLLNDSNLFLNNFGDDRYVSLLTNNIGVEIGDGNKEGDEVDDDFDLRLENASDDDDEDEDGIDLVTPTAPNPEFTSIPRVYETQGSNWANWKSVVTYDVRGEFCVGQTFPNKRSLTENVTAIIEIIIDKYNYKITYMKAWKAKQKALADIFGDWDLSYRELPRYFEALKEANPGTVVQFVNYEIEDDDDNEVIFGRVFWAFGASIKGFPHCRPIITIDGTHLYGKYKGVLMIVMGVDANDQLYPLAFAIV
ncbi:hypothetical protein KSS87_018423 [Heliosperma pusillum]|nr:hypothetical protein KSS87_018423 [Heliosperma pusillum]